LDFYLIIKQTIKKGNVNSSIYHKGGDAMPGIRERDQGDKIKNHGKRKGGRPVQQEARRVMTAKLKKELAQQRWGGSSTTEQPYYESASTTTEVVNQVEQTTGAVIQETSQQIRQGVSKAVTKAKKGQQQIKKQQDQPEDQKNSADVPAPNILEQLAPETASPVPTPTEVSWTQPGSIHQEVPTVTTRPVPRTRPDTRSVRLPEPKTHPTGTAIPKKKSVPTPDNRMLQQAVDTRREQARHQDRTTTLLENNGQPTVEHYSNPSVSSSILTVPKENFSPQNQSIYPSIKERPRRSFSLKEKPTAGAITPKTRPSVGQATRSVAVPGNAPVPVERKHTTAAKHITDRVRRKAQREAQRMIFQNTKKYAKAAADLSKKAVAATTKAVKALIGALSTLVGGTALIAALCVIFLVASVIASPFGILFANEPSPGAVPLNAAVSQINMELTDKLTLLQSGNYDSIDIQGTGPDWQEVAAVFACKTAIGAGSVDVAALTPDRVDWLKAVFWDMCSITTSVETIDHPAVGSTEAWTEKNLHITVTAKTADEMRTAYLFTREQNNTLTELLSAMNGIGDLLGDLSVSQQDATELLRRLPTDLSLERRSVVETACKLVGKVNYFWGGKSRVLGWDSRWGTLQKVWAAGSSTTGTYQPFGLDCSGFADWVFYNISGGSYVLGHGGGAHAQHTYCTAITWEQAQPGDLVFYPGDTHVGIVGGWDDSGNILIIHCSYSYNNVVITGQEGFTSIGRPMYYGT